MACSVSSPGFEEHYSSSRNTNAPFIRYLEKADELEEEIAHGGRGLGVAWGWPRGGFFQIPPKHVCEGVSSIEVNNVKCRKRINESRADRKSVV